MFNIVRQNILDDLIRSKKVIIESDCIPCLKYDLCESCAIRTALDAMDLQINMECEVSDMEKNDVPLIDKAIKEVNMHITNIKIRLWECEKNIERAEGKKQELATELTKMESLAELLGGNELDKRMDI